MGICKVTYEVEKGLPFNGVDSFYIKKTLSLFNRELFSEKLVDFFDKKIGPTPFLIENDARHRCRIMRMLEDENPFSFIADKYYVGDDLEGKLEGFFVYKERFIFGFSLVTSEEKHFKTYAEAADYMNEIYEKKYIR